ncbi:helix-turn-helix transcriptional regulator [Rhodovulum sp. 12E13]|nr:helix-turn-helix transcriptional regulator [Rhodovulum sp. 12E13]
MAQWSHGKVELETALGATAELFGAMRCSLVTVHLASMASEIAGTETCSFTSTKSDRVAAFGAGVLRADLRRIEPGDYQFLSRMGQLPYRLSGGIDTDLAALGVEDALFICVGKRRGIVELLELLYDRRPDSEGRRIVAWIAPKLLKAYQLGKSARVDAEISSREREVAAHAEQAKSLPGRNILDYDNPSMLTRSEWRVCELASRGLTAKSIAHELGVTSNTVRSHLRSIYSKTDIGGFHELVYTLMATQDKAEWPAGTGTCGS